MVSPPGLEPGTHGLGIHSAVQLRQGDVSKESGAIRYLTCSPLAFSWSSTGFVGTVPLRSTRRSRPDAGTPFRRTPTGYSGNEDRAGLVERHRAAFMTVRRFFNAASVVFRTADVGRSRNMPVLHRALEIAARSGASCRPILGAARACRFGIVMRLGPARDIVRRGKQGTWR